MYLIMSFINLLIQASTPHHCTKTAVTQFTSDHHFAKYNGHF